jgi:uncharacterized protein GlcG (DUF336 family)
MSLGQATGVGLGAVRTIVEQALAHARGSDFPPMTVAVLDAAGQVVAFAREDGSSLLRGRIERARARGALNMGVGSRSLAARAAAHPAFVNALASLADGNLVLVPDGVLIRDDNDEVIGAVGVSGSLPDDDEACAIHRITAADLRADPGAADPT